MALLDGMLILVIFIYKCHCSWGVPPLASVWASKSPALSLDRISQCGWFPAGGATQLGFSWRDCPKVASLARAHCCGGAARARLSTFGMCHFDVMSWDISYGSFRLCYS